MMNVFVTGGASGIGLKVAQIFAERGERVVSFDLEPQPGALARSYRVDITDAGAIEAAFRQAADEVGPPAIVFHSAGIGGFSRRFEEFPLERFDRLVRVNLIGTRNVAAAALPLLRPGGKLALVASLAGLVTAYGQSGYAASKHGVVGLASVLRVELKPKGIDVCVICPPEIDTPMVQDERLTRPPETTAMKLFAGIVDLDEGCRYMVDRVLRGRFLIIPGRRARLAWMMQKLLPRVVVNAVADRMVARVQRRGEVR